MKSDVLKLVMVICAFAWAGAAEAATVSQREYKRGYNDCSNGRYDQNQHGASYKKGCRAAENKRGKKKVKEATCPIGIAWEDRVTYPACQQ
jgi:hypothetical protein